MRFLSRSLISLLLLWCCVLTANAAESPLSSYKLGSGDLITVRVLGEDDYKREKVRLSDAGTISFPFLGEIRVLGLTVGELEKLITTGLDKRFLINPQVTVTIEEYRQFYVNGQVIKPAGYAYVPGLTVRKAISLAGGFRDRAAPDKIYIIGDSDDRLSPRRVDLNASVNPGDIITVEESFF
jgi:protein involved in polysaccharide export with SLBB domain